MNKTKIEWCDYTWNPITGCKNGCEYCYARRMAQRLKGRYGYPQKEPFTPTFHLNRLTEPCQMKKPAKIFTVSMGEMFGSWVGRIWVDRILRIMWDCSAKGTAPCPNHIFQVLTKFPHNLPYFIEQFPPNLWIGASVENQQAAPRLRCITDPVLKKRGAKVVWASIEPLHSSIILPTRILEGLDWMVIGAETGNRKGKVEPKENWIKSLLACAQAYDIPVFLKDNLKPYWLGEWYTQYPEVVK